MTVLPIARTLALFDASNWFAEVTAEGALMIERRGLPGPAASALPPAPSGDPSAFDDAPKTVLGMEVRSIAAVVDQRRTDGATDRDEYAIQAWYVGPNPATPCSQTDPAIHPLRPPCDEGRHWLLDHPEAFGVAVGQLRRDPAQYPNALNPPMPADLRFDVPATWIDGRPIPQPVVVVGHFNGRVNAYHGNVYFTIDALAWTRDRPISSLDTILRLTTAASEDPASVVGRVEAETDHVAVATWMTVIDAKDFASLEPEFLGAEFNSGNPVWIVRRLVRDERDGRERLAVERAYTSDNGHRVWLTETPDSDVDLSTTIDVGPFGEHTRRVEVYDYGQWVVSVRRATAADNLNWQPTNPKRDGIVEVARGATDRDVGIRWNGGACAPDWQVQVKVESRADGEGLWIQPVTYGNFCESPGEMVTRALVITFDRPIDLDRVRSHDGSCCG